MEIASNEVCGAKFLSILTLVEERTSIPKMQTCVQFSLNQGAVVQEVVVLVVVKMQISTGITRFKPRS